MTKLCNIAYMFSVLICAGIMSSGALHAQTMDYNNLQFPGSGSIDPVASLTVYAQCFESGVTEAAGQGTGVECWIGVHTTNTDPSTWPTSAFTAATFSSQVGNNDEFSLAIGNGLAPGTYYYASRFSLSSGPFTYGGFNSGTWDGSTNISGVLTINDPQLDYNNLQFPGTATIDYGTGADIYAQAYEAGVTEAAGAGTGIECWIGVNATDTDPSTWLESSFQLATFNSQVGNNDEFTSAIGAELSPGTYYYASRFRFNGGSFSYGGFNSGTWDGSTNISGVLTVNSIPAIFINEVDVDDLSTDDESFVELYGPANASLDGMSLVFYNGSSDLSYRAIDLDGQSLDATGYFVLGSSGVANVDLVQSGDFMQNGADAVVLVVGDASSYPNGTAITSSGIIDALVYDTGQADDAGLLVLLNSGQPQINEDANLLKEIQSMARNPDGGVQLNTDSYVVQSPSPGTSNAAAVCSLDDIVFVSTTACNPVNNSYTATLTITYTSDPGSGTLDVNGQSFAITSSPQSVVLTNLNSDGLSVDVTAEFSDDPLCTRSETAVYTAPSSCIVNTLVINELDYDQDGADTEEFVEIYNAGATGLDLSNFTLDLINGSGAVSYETVTFPSVTLAAGDYYVVCFGSNASAYCDQTVSTSMQNGAPEAVALSLFGSIVDVVSYEGDVPGYVEGTGIVSGDEDRNNRSLLRIPNGADSDDNDTDFVLACISPGAANFVCPANDECEDAMMISVSTFGTPAWDTLSVVNATESLSGCTGDANDDVWFSFVAADANDYIVAQDVNGLTELVIEVFDACNGTSLGCYNNYGVGAIERVMPGGLVSGTTYYYRVYDLASGTPASTDIRTQVKTWADGEIRDKFCGITDYTLDEYITPERQDLNELYPFTSVNVTGYGVRFIDPILEDTTAISKTGYASQYFQINEFSPSYNTSYNVSARHRLKLHANGNFEHFWSDWGPSCTIGVAGVNETKIRDEYCDNAVDYQLADQIQAEYVLNASAYRFTLTEGMTSIVEVNAGYGIYFYEFDGIELNKTYEVTVEAQVDGVWSVSGDSCTVHMALGPENTALQGAYCNGTFEYPTPDYILAEYVYGATAYEWSFTPVGGGTELTDITSGLSLSFHLTSMDLEIGTSYDVRVRVFAAGLWGDFSDMCPITIQAPAAIVNGDGMAVTKSVEAIGLESNYTLYPNPNAGSEMTLNWANMDQDVSTITIEVSDLTGKIIQTELRPIKGENGALLLKFKNELNAGMYLLSIQSSGNRETQTFIVE